jgi:hypothetical protein
MKHIEWIDEYWGCTVNCEPLPDIKISKPKQYHVHPIFLVYFIGVRVYCTWLFLNFIQILRLFFTLEWCGFIALSHVDSVGVSIEFYDDHKKAKVFADSWDNGKLHQVELASWDEHDNYGALIPPCQVRIKDSEISVIVFKSKEYTATCEVEREYNFLAVRTFDFPVKIN